MEKINFADMSQDEKQVFCDFLLKEQFRHLDDVLDIKRDLDTARDKYGIKPRSIYVGKRVEVACEKEGEGDEIISKV